MRIILFILLFFPLFSSGEDKELDVIRLICRYTHSVNDKAEFSKNTDVELVKVILMENNSVAIKKQNMGSLFFGFISEEEIKGDVTFKIKDVDFIQELTINRYTGSFELTFRMAKEVIGVVHFGKCETTKEKLF